MPAVIGLFLLMLMFADELVRMTTGRPTTAPFDLPEGVEIRVAPRLVRIIGAPSGGATAVTVGKTILLPQSPESWISRHPARFSADSAVLSGLIWREVIRHELVHVQQRERYGRWYLPLYIAGYLRHGYNGHPLELEAEAR